MHFGQGSQALWDKIYHEGGDDEVEGSAGERQGLRVADLKVRAPADQLVACVLDLSRRNVDPEHGRGRLRANDQLGEQACAATDLKPVRALRRCQPVKEDGTSGAAPAPDESLIGDAVVEAMRWIYCGQARRSWKMQTNAGHRQSGLMPAALTNVALRSISFWTYASNSPSPTCFR
jgi:hypothetical protein